MTEEIVKSFFETLSEETSVEHFTELYDESVSFKDPFQDVRGVTAVHAVFEHMYRNLDDPRFIIREYLKKESIVYVKWEFLFAFKNEEKKQSFEGVSRLELNDAGKVKEHIDYWDAAEHMYEKMPLIGSILRYIKRKIVRR
jgi:steroid delta-isomerase